MADEPWQTAGDQLREEARIGQRQSAGDRGRQGVGAKQIADVCAQCCAAL